MNTNEIYRQVINKGVVDVKIPEVIHVDEVANSMWLSHEYSRLFFKYLNDKKNEFLERAMCLAFSPDCSDTQVRYLVQEAGLLERVINTAKKGTYAAS